MNGVYSFQVPLIWPRVVDRVEDALAYGNGEYELEDIYNELVSGGMQLWIDRDSMCITTLIKYPRRLSCLVVAAGGSLDVLKRNLPELEAWAVAQGADCIEVMGRRGWVRALPDYKEQQVHLRKELCGLTPHSSAVH